MLHVSSQEFCPALLHPIVQLESKAVKQNLYICTMIPCVALLKSIVYSRFFDQHSVSTLQRQKHFFLNQRNSVFSSYQSHQSKKRMLGLSFLPKAIIFKVQRNLKNTFAYISEAVVCDSLQKLSVIRYLSIFCQNRQPKLENLPVLGSAATVFFRVLCYIWYTNPEKTFVVSVWLWAAPSKITVNSLFSSWCLSYA